MADELITLPACSLCGTPLTAEEMIPSPDPYMAEIHNDQTPVLMCAKCREERHLDT